VGGTDHPEDPVPHPFEKAPLDSATDLYGGEATSVGLGEGEAAVLAGGELLHEVISTPEEGVPERTRIGKSPVSRPGALGDRRS
jgi:hypothetical protein